MTEMSSWLCGGVDDDEVNFVDMILSTSFLT